MTLQDGQVVLTRFPHTDGSTGKLRPALVIRRLPGRHDDWLICPITSSRSQEIAGFDEVIEATDADFPGSGLKEASVIRIARLAAVAQQFFVGAIGRVSADRLRAIKGRLAGWISESPQSA